MRIPTGKTLEISKNPSTKARHFLSFDDNIAKTEEIWTEHPSTHNGKQVYVADVEVITMYKELGKLPKVNNAYVIPHPTRQNECLSPDEFGEMQEQKDMYGDVDAQAWELEDKDVYLILLKKA